MLLLCHGGQEIQFDKLISSPSCNAVYSPVMLYLYCIFSFFQMLLSEPKTEGTIAF